MQAEKNQKKLMKIPITTFTGTLRQISPRSLNPVGEAILRLCAPKFLPATQEQRSQRLEAMREKLSPYVKHVYVPARPLRRWSGDYFSDFDDKYHLDRGSYFSVCQNENGYDAGTLEAELNAYRSTEVNFYVIFMDALIDGNAQHLNLEPSAHILALLSHPQKALEHLAGDAPDELRRLMMQAADREIPLVISLGTVITSAKIEGVLDLREHAAQQWFFETYVTHGVVSSHANCFLDIMPELLQPHLGGSTASNMRLQVIGADLRRMGINGLIYPSARTDIGVGYANGKITRFRGWDMVLYQGQPPREAYHIDLGDWETEFWKGIKVHKETDLSGRLSQWYVEGLDALNMARYDYEMQMRGVIP